MKTRAVLCWLIPLLLLGCGINGKAEYEQGLQLTNSQNYEQAINWFKQALEKEPDNLVYKEKLNWALKQRVSELTQPLDKVFSGQVKHVSELKQARQVVAKVAELDKHKAQSLNQALAESEKSFTSEIEIQYQATQQHIAGKDWLAASKTLKQVEKKYPDYKETQSLLQSIKIQGSADYLAQAQTAFDQEKFVRAMELAEQTLVINPDENAASLLLAQAQKNNSADYFIEQAELAEKRKYWITAQSYYQKALKLGEDGGPILAKIKRAKINQELTLISKSNGYLADGYLYKAYQGYLQAKKFSFAKNAVQLNALKVFLMVKIMARADKQFFEDKFGNAYFWFDLLSRIADDKTELVSKQSASRAKIKARLQADKTSLDYFKNAQAEKDPLQKVELLSNALLFASERGQTQLVQQSKAEMAKALADYKFN